MKVEGSLELLITLGEKNKRRIMKQSFMVAKIITPYNAIFGRLILNELSVFLYLRYLLMKFKINKGVMSIRCNQVEVRKGCRMISRAAMK